MKFFLFLILFSMSIIFARILDRCSLLSYVLSEFLLSCDIFKRTVWYLSSCPFVTALSYSRLSHRRIHSLRTRALALCNISFQSDIEFVEPANLLAYTRRIFMLNLITLEKSEAMCTDHDRLGSLPGGSSENLWLTS